MTSNNYGNLKPLFKASYGKPAKGVDLRTQNEKVYKPAKALQPNANVFPKLKTTVKFHY